MNQDSLSQENNVNVPHEEYERIAKEIESAASPVGIDAKKTHVMILHMLSEIDARLQRLEERLQSDVNAR